MMNWFKSGILICMIFGAVFIVGCGGSAQDQNANRKALESTPSVSAAAKPQSTAGEENLKSEEAAPAGQQKPEGELSTSSPHESSPEKDMPKLSNAKSDAPDTQPPAKEIAKTEKQPATSPPSAQSKSGSALPPKSEKKTEPAAPKKLAQPVEKNDSPYRDGSYSASAEGYNGPISVAVTISGGKISRVVITDNTEDEPYLTDSKTILQNMVSRQTADVDVVTGATVTCKGIIKAVKIALSKATL